MGVRLIDETDDSRFEECDHVGTTRELRPSIVTCDVCGKVWSTSTPKPMPTYRFVEK